MRLKGEVAIVTGAARGLGLGIARKLSAEGADVALGDVNLGGAEAAAAELGSAREGARTFAGLLDVADRASVEAFVRAAEEALGPIDILVNNAGINRDAMLHKMTDEQWHSVLSVCLTGTFYCLQTVAVGMRERGRGRIVNISSASWQGNIGQANYAAAKAGVIGLTKTAARELARHAITVNAICPGFIDTEMTRGVPEKVWDLMVSKIPMGRVGSPQDVANVVAFLASDEADYLTGVVVDVGGGMVI